MWKKSEGEKAKSQSQDCCVTFNPPPPKKKTSFRQEIVEWIPEGKSSCSAQADQDEGKWKALTLAFHWFCGPQQQVMKQMMVMQGSKKFLSSCLGQVDFFPGKKLLKFTCPAGKGLSKSSCN